MDYQEIIERIPLRKTFSQYTKLTADGSFWKGDCPLCDAKDNNLLLSTEKKIFYCYSCQIEGTPIDFIAKVEKCTTKQAAQQLVNMWGLQEAGEVGESRDATKILMEKFKPVLEKLAKD